MHGGALYTAFDCLSGWTVLLLRGEPVLVRVEGSGAGGERVAEGEFHIVQLATPKWKKVLGLDRLPATWAKLLDE